MFRIQVSPFPTLFGRRRQHRLLFVLVAFFTLASPLSAQLVINEVSQGPSGTKEWVELLVTGTPNCSGIPTVDLRGWYLDDNNGTFATGSGTGIATGCMRFTTDPLWASVPIGTLIVVYNNADVDASIPAQDLSLSDGNCRLVIPGNNCTLIERHTSQPSTASSTFPTSGFTSCGDWGTVSMNNSFDSFQTRDPSGTLVHAVSWGNNSSGTIIFFGSSAGGTTMWMNNASNNNPNLQANWIQTSVAGETPGAPNNPANAAWIASMNNNCTPFVALNASGSSTNTCSCTGTATANASGGIAPYTYSWAPSGGTNATATGLCPDTYTCTVTDAAGCTQIVTAIVGAAPSPTVSILFQSDVSCNGANDGAATVNVTGGSGNYTYSWAPSGGNNASATGLDGNTYVVTVTDAGGCSSNATVVISEPVVLTTTASQTNVSCNGGSDGSATVTPSGGTPGYTYSWSPSGGNSATATNLGASVYTCTITDSHSCTITQTFSITQPAPLTASAGNGGTFCAGDSILLSGTAGGSFTSLTWQGGTGTFSAPNAASTYYTSGPGDNGTVTLTLTVSDVCGNNVSSTVNITVNPQAIAQLVAGGPTTLCPGDSVLLTASGGTNYLWSTGATNASIYAATAGNYSVIVSNSCGSDTAFASISVTPAPSAQITASGPTTLCAGDSVTLTASGGGSYTWSTGATTTSITVNATGIYFVAASASCGTDTAFQTVTVIPAPSAQISASGPVTFCMGDSVTLTASGGTNYTWSTGATTASITVLNGGNYYVVANASCGNDTAFQTITVNPLPVAAITASGPLTFCQGDSVTLTASGGTNFSWSTMSTNNAITVSTAGTYTVTVSNACGSDTAQQAVAILPAPVAAISASGPTTFCSGDNVTLTASGGTSYLWSTTATTPSITVSAAGTYTVAVTNACGTGIAQQVITVLPIPAATISASGPTTFCTGNNVALTASGGNTYLWSTGSTSPTITVSTAGTYSVIVSNSCGSDTATQQITVLQLPVVSVAGGTVLCPGEQATLTASGGVTYVWSNGGTASSIVVSTAGTYTVIASNSCGSDTGTVIVTPSNVQASFSASTDSGGVPLTVSFTDNSVNAASWSWNFGNSNTSSTTNPTEIFQQAGIYTVVLTVTNPDGCTDTASMLITVTDVPAVFTIPNVFTPNADGTNDVFFISSEGLAEMSLQIFDRWGVLMAEITSPQAGWDGHSTSGMPASDGTYYYVFTATGYNGKNYNAKGFFQLIR